MQKYAAQIDVYNAQVKAYTAQANTLARQAQQTIEQTMFDTLSDPNYIHPSKRGFPAMASKKIVFTVYEAANGYFVETAGGALVVGTTLSEVCTAAQGKVAEEKMLEENIVERATRDDPLAQRATFQQAQWEKINKALIENMKPMKFLDKFALMERELSKPPNLFDRFRLWLQR
jgi:hypothetical protein